MMTCEESKVLLHALLDGELDAGHARDVEAHLAGCASCAAELAQFRELRAGMARADLRYAAPAGLRRRVESALPVHSVPGESTRPSRRGLLRGLALGAAVSAAAAAGIVFAVVRSNQDQRILDDVVSAHLRSLQAEHLTDVASSDQHTVKPWFNGRLDVAPPVADLTAQGFTLLGGRLDFIDGQAVAAIVYRRRVHVINLFVAPSISTQHTPLRTDMVHGFHVGRWSDQGLSFIAISDINPDELQEFHTKYETVARAGT